MKILSFCSAAAWGIGCWSLLASCANAQQPQANIALGKSVTFSVDPNYADTKSPDNKTQLTDGKLSEAENDKTIWLQKGTVGWQSRSPVVITIDLGAVQPISGVSYSTGAGRADVHWPAAITIAVSDDNQTWHLAGDLVELSRKNGAPPAEGYASFRYTTRDLKTHGRYIAIAVVSSPYIFVDEIEVYGGDPQWLGAPVGGEAFRDITEYSAYALQSVNILGARRRLRNDADAVRALVQAANLPAARRSTLLARLDEQVAAISNFTSLPADFKAIVPLNDTHRNILAVHGELLAAQGAKPLTVWKQHRYDWLPLLAKPAVSEKNELNFSMLRNQFRSDALLLTNAGAAPRTVNLKLTNPPKNAQPGWFKIDAVAWTDTQNGEVVADALIPVDAKNGVYAVTVPAGMTRKIWFTVDSSRVAAGDTVSTLEVNGGDTQLRVPVAFNISNVAMKTPRISLGMWDDTTGHEFKIINSQNRDAAIALMRSHYVDTPWANYALPRPGAEAFDAQNNLKEKLDFSQLDEWVAQWPGARRYFVFMNVESSPFGGAEITAPEFAPRIGSWAKAVSAHMKELGLRPDQLGILLVDEPRNAMHDDLTAAWAKAINAAAPELTLFSDPVWERPDQTKNQAAITEMDVLSPNLPIYYRGGKPAQEYYANLLRQGKELWLYQATGPVRTYDPQTYYRYQAWHTFAIGGTGQGFWAFSDIGKAPSSWNEYAAAGISYAPAFLDQDSVNNSIHWDAVREGMEDFEELAMLRDAIQSSKDAAWKARAQKTLDDAVQTVTGVWKDDGYDWKKESDPNLADAQLAKVRALLKP